MDAILQPSQERHMYITTHTSHFNLAETGPSVYWGTLGTTSLETLNLDVCFLQEQVFMLAGKPLLLDIDFSAYVSNDVHGWPTPKACPLIQVVGIPPSPEAGPMEAC
jgi:hypothetical protein